MTLHPIRHLPFVVVLCIALLSSCTQTTQQGDVIVNTSDPVSDAITLTSQGWSSFESGNYSSAVTLFRQAIGKYDQLADAYNGLAWSYARMDSMQKALHYFDIALGQQGNLTDANAGRAFVSLALGDYPSSIYAVDAVLASGIVFYTFRHDERVSMNDLLLVKAQSYFMLHAYGESQAIIDKLDPHNNLDVYDPGYVENLAREIERLWTVV